MSLIRERLDELIRSRPRPPFLFEVGQTVRVRSTLTANIHAVQEMLGRQGIVVARSRSPLLDRRSYDVRIEGRIEPFEEDELDMRYARTAVGEE